MLKLTPVERNESILGTVTITPIPRMRSFVDPQTRGKGVEMMWHEAGWRQIAGTFGTIQDVDALLDWVQTRELQLVDSWQSYWVWVRGDGKQSYSLFRLIRWLQSLKKRGVKSVEMKYVSGTRYRRRRYW